MKQTEKWCPMARLFPASDEALSPAGNRFLAGCGLADKWLHVKCLGSACAVFVADRLSDDPDEGRCGLIQR